MSDLESVLAYCETQIPWWQPQVGREERTLIGQVLDSQFLNDGAVTREFEQVLAERLGCRHVVTVTSGTAALFAALYGLGIGPGDEVIVPDVTFVATANAVTLTGATPILVDVEPQRLTLDPRAVRQALTPKTKALVPVHLSGRAADMETLLTIADEHNLVVVEDAAEALFSSRQGRCLGTFGQAGCFSFSPMKMIQTGQGGAIATNDDTLFVRLKEIKDQGRRETGTGGGDDVHHAVGFNFKLTNLHAAVGLVQLNRAQDRRERVIRH